MMTIEPDPKSFKVIMTCIRLDMLKAIAELNII